MIGAASIALAAGAQKPARHAQESAAERMFILYSSVLKRWTPGSGPVARRQNRVGGPVDGGGAGAPTWGRALAGAPDRDRKGGGEGKSGSGRVVLGGRRIIKKQKH